MQENIHEGQRLSKGIMGLTGRLWYLVVGVGVETEGGFDSPAGVARYAGMCSYCCYEDSLRRTQALKFGSCKSSRLLRDNLRKQPPHAVRGMSRRASNETKMTQRPGQSRSVMLMGGCRELSH